ncbi:MAG: DUF6599 family protein [Phycisphaerae bacterium]|jgi:hypothetical protein
MPVVYIIISAICGDTTISSAKRQPTRLESAIATALIAVPVIIILVIFVSQKNADISRFGITAEIAEKPQGQQGINPAELAPPQGFEKFGPGEYYDQETLYEKIDGKAPLYLESGFVKLFTQRYVNGKNYELTYELYVYDMGLTGNAFSVYSVQRRAGSSPGNLQFSYSTDNGLFLSYGKYYCEFIGSSDSPLLLDAIDFTANALIENLKDAGPVEIPQLDMFASQNLVPGSYILYLNSAYGFTGLTNTYSAKYKINGETVTAFISKQPDGSAAQKLAEQYVDFLIANGGEKIQSPDADTQYVDLYGSIEIVSVKDSFVYGIHQAEDKKAAENALALISEKLDEEK